MKQILFLLLFPCLCLAQYQGNANQKITLGEQTTADGLVYRGVENDTALITPLSDTSAYIILDTVNNRFFHYIRNTNVWTRLNLLPSDTTSFNYVNTYGTQTVNGAKTFTSAVTASRFNPTSSTASGNGMYLPETNTLGFSTNSKERFRITSFGDFGIDNNSPQEKLHLTDSIRGFVGFRITGTGLYAGSDWVHYASSLTTNSADDFYGLYNRNTDDGVSIGYMMRIFKDETIRIGTSNPKPTARLEIDAGSQTRAPLKFTSGVNLISPLGGEMEFNGTNLFFSPSTTRHTVNHGLTGSATLNFPSTTTLLSADLTITVTGAADGDVVSLGVPNAAVNANTSYSAWVSAANTVTVRFNNYSSGTVDPASGTFKVFVTK